MGWNVMFSLCTPSGVWRSESRTPLILVLGTRGRWMVCFTPLAALPMQKEPPIPTGWTQRLVSTFGENTNHMSLRGIEASSCGQLALSLVNIPTALHRLTEMLCYHTNVRTNTKKQAEKPSTRSWCIDVFKLTGIFWRNSTCFSCTRVHSMKAHRGSRYTAPLILNLGIRNKCSASCPDCFYLR
jgi:hypothetical protein